MDGTTSRGQPRTSPAPRSSPLGADFWKVLGVSGASNLADGIFQVALPLIAATIRPAAGRGPDRPDGRPRALSGQMRAIPRHPSPVTRLVGPWRTTDATG